MREAHTEAEVEAGHAGARKTLTFIVKNENCLLYTSRCV